jgi:hypothetical protein
MGKDPRARAIALAGRAVAGEKENRALAGVIANYACTVAWVRSYTSYYTLSCALRITRSGTSHGYVIASGRDPAAIVNGRPPPFLIVLLIASRTDLIASRARLHVPSRARIPAHRNWS